MSSLPASEHRLPAPTPKTSSLSSQIGWLVALVLVLMLAALLACRNFELTTTIRLMQTDADLSKVEVQSLKQQLEAERIIATRQIAMLTENHKSEPLTFVHLNAQGTGTSGTGLDALIAWQPSAQSGLFFATQLPQLGPDEEYRLWLEGSAGKPVSAGVVNRGPQQETKVEFTTAQPVDQVARISLTRERLGSNTEQPTGPVVLRGSP